MSFIHIKKIQKPDPETHALQDCYAVPAVALTTPQGKKLIPNPSGKEAMVFKTLEEAEEAVRRAGFDYEFEGRKTYTLSQRSTSEPIRLTGNPLDRAVPILIERLRDREPSVVANAAFALGAIRSTEAMHPLAEILGHDDPTVRKHVAEALARLGAPALGTLKEAYQTAVTSKDKNAPYVRLTVMNAYLEMVIQNPHASLDPVMAQILEALNDENWLVRSQAALIIGHAAQAGETAE